MAANVLLCIWNMVRLYVCKGPVWLRWQTEQTAGLHTRHMIRARCYDTFAPIAPWIPGDQSGDKLETVWKGLIHARPGDTHTHVYRLSLRLVVTCRLYILIIFKKQIDYNAHYIRELIKLSYMRHRYVWTYVQMRIMCYMFHRRWQSSCKWLHTLRSSHLRLARIFICVYTEHRVLSLHRSGCYANTSYTLCL